VTIVRWAALLVLSLVVLPDDAAAQKSGTLAAGGSVAVVAADDPDVRGLSRIGPLIRYGESRDGWGPRVGLNWFNAEVDESVNGITSRFGRLRIRPVMAGYGYTKVFGLIAVSGNMLAGYGLTSFTLQPAFRDAYIQDRGVETLRTRVSDAFVFKPEISTWIDVSEKFGVNVSAGYVVARPNVILQTSLGSDRRSIDADVFMLKIGLVYSVF
jgi:hypothetical protein